MFLSSNTPNVRIECKGRLLDAVFDTGNVKSDFGNKFVQMFPEALSGLVEVVAGMIPAAGREDFHFIDLNVIDEKGNPIDPDDLYIESPRIYENGEEDTHYIHPDYVDEKHTCRIYWDAGMRDEAGYPLKEATLRIEADGYDDPIIIKVKYPKRNAKKTIKFKHKKK